MLLKRASQTGNTERVDSSSSHFEACALMISVSLINTQTAF